MTSTDTTTNLKKEDIKENFHSISSFFTLAYGVILTLSISYNIGYFKYINPQIHDLMTLTDYIDASTHHLWFFLLAIILFFTGSLAFVKKRLDQEFGQVLMVGIFSLIVSLVCFFQNSHYSKLWPTIKMIIYNTKLLPIFILSIALIGCLISFIIFKLTFNSANKKTIPVYSVSIMSICIFLLLVLVPYLSGMVQGHIEANYLTPSDYEKQSVNIKLAEHDFKDVFIIKHIDKGLIIRQFNASKHSSKSQFLFIELSSIEYITYKSLN